MKEELNNQKVHVDNWVTVKFCEKKSMKYIDVLVIEGNHDVLAVKFDRRSEDNRFKWSDVTNVSQVDLV